MRSTADPCRKPDLLCTSLGGRRGSGVWPLRMSGHLLVSNNLCRVLDVTYVMAYDCRACQMEASCRDPIQYAAASGGHRHL